MKKNVLVRRLLAGFCDSLILTVLSLSILIIGAFADIPVYVYADVVLLLMIFYHPVFCSFPAHATFGMLIAGIRCETRDHRRAGFGKLLLRNVMMLILCAPLGLTFFLAFATRDKLSLYDRMFPGITITATPERSSDRGRYPQIAEIKNGRTSRSYRVLPGGLTIGRDASACNVLIPSGNQTVSRCHCRVDYNVETDMFLLEDMGSVNGVYLIDGRRIPSGGLVAIENGTVFYLGTREVAFKAIL